MRLTGDTLGALQAERALEQEGMSAAVVELMKRRDALVDEAAATQEATRAAEEAAALQRAVANERYSLESRLIPLLGDTAEATALMAAQLGRERDALDESNLALFDRIKALEAEAAAAAEAARAAEDLAARNKAIADEISGLDRQWLQLIGDVDTLRSLQLGDLLSDGAREKQLMIWAEQDRQAAEEAARRAAEEAARAAEQAAQAYARATEEHNKAIEAARNTLAQAYERESSALRQTIETFRDFSRSIREFRDGLLGSVSPDFGLARAQAAFASTSRMAGLGSEKALGSFAGDAQTYLDAAMQYGTESEYKNALAAVLAGSDQAAAAGKGVADMAQRQLTEMQRSVAGIIDIEKSVTSVSDALDAYNQTLSAQVPTFSKVVSAGLSQVTTAITDQTSQSQASDEKRTAAEVSFAGRLANIETLLERVIRGDAIQIAADDPINVNVTNTPANPVPVDQVEPA